LAARTFTLSLARAFDGLALALTQRNMRVHVVTGLGVIAGGMVVDLGPGQWLALLSAIFVVLVTESLNCAVEATVDLATAEVRPLARIAKDIAAGAVLLSAIYGLAVALLVFVPAAAALGPAGDGGATGNLWRRAVERWPWSAGVAAAALADLALLFGRGGGPSRGGVKGR
jgi:undecaprenol kinase